MKPEPHQLIINNYAYTTELEPRFADMDAQQHINHISIGRLFEEARMKFLRTHFSDLPPLRRVTASVLFNYLGEVSYPEPVTIGVAIGHIGNSSYNYCCLMMQNGKPVATSICTDVCSTEGKSQAIPASYVAALKQHMLKDAEDS